MHSSTLTKSKRVWASVLAVGSLDFWWQGSFLLEPRAVWLHTLIPLCAWPMLVPFSLRQSWTVFVFSLLNLRGLLCVGDELGTGTTG